jgi:ABC-type sulfate/molybdate transport systems ATPase subunit
VRIDERSLEQTNLALSTMGIGRRDPDRYALDIMNTALGRGMSSRLFREVRERRGLAYSVSSGGSRYRDIGNVTVSAGVTRDHQEEALEVSDRVVIMNEGRIEQSGTPEEVYEHPATPFVYGFLGDVNLFHGRINQGKVNIGEGELDAPEWADAKNQAGVAYVRPYDVAVGASPGASSLEARVRHVRTFGPVVRLDLELAAGGRIIEAHVPRDRFENMAITKGQLVYVSPTSVRVFGLPS